MTTQMTQRGENMGVKNTIHEKGGGQSRDKHKYSRGIDKHPGMGEDDNPSREDVQDAERENSMNDTTSSNDTTEVNTDDNPRAGNARAGTASLDE